MKEFDTLKMINNPALDAMRDLQENGALAAIRELQASTAFTAALNFETTGAFAAVRELQSALNAVKSPMSGVTAALEEYRKIVAPISESVKAMNIAYAPIFEQTRAFDSLNIKGILAGLQTSSAAMRAVSRLNLSGIASIVDALPKYNFLSDIVSDDFSVADVEELYENGEITQEDINEEISEIVSKKQFSPKAEWDKFKKSKWFLAIKILIVLVTFVCNPVTEYATDKVLDEFGINEFWENSGVYDLIDSIFGESEDGAVSETEAKQTVDKAKTGNISKQKRDDLIEKIGQIRAFISAAPQDENTGNLLTYLSELEKDVRGKKYGLIFEEHREEIDEVLDTHAPVLSEDESLFIDNGGQMNFLIEGDNLASLMMLEKTHKGKIDLIYIDPPYNTQKEGFTYSDTLVDKNDTFRHSKWLSFMKQRMNIAHNLLCRNGVIFISIDDNEVATLRMLCDEIFGHQNFVANVIWEKKFSPQNDAKWLSDSHDHILVYAKNKEKWHPNLLSRTNEMDSRYKNPDNDVRGVWTSGDLSVKTYSASTDYPITTPSGRVVNPPSGYSWRYSKEKFEEMVADNRIWFGKNGDNVPRIKRFLSDVQQGQVCKTIWHRTEVGDTQEGTKDLKEAFNGEGVFTNPKPIRLIERVLDIASSDNSIILDFFAGSGTTGHAVLKYNAEHTESNRRFILCTNNENNICRDVTYERIKRVIDREGYSASLKYYKVDYVPISERLYYEYADELLYHVRELVELENGINFTGNAEIAIVLTEEELDNFIKNEKDFSKCRKLYMGHDILPSDTQEQILKMRGIEISIIPDYYYRDLQQN